MFEIVEIFDGIFYHKSLLKLNLYVYDDVQFSFAGFKINAYSIVSVSKS